MRRLLLLAAALVLAGAAPAPSIPEELRARVATDPNAQSQLGELYLDAGDEPSLAAAREWFCKAADGGHAEAMNNCAAMLMTGQGGPADDARGRALRDRAVEKGSFGAMLTLADRYAEGVEGYPRDPARALALLRSAAEAPGEAGAYAKWRLAMAYLQGQGVKPDKQHAFRLLVEASEAGGVRAMISRAVMLATGDGVVEDDAAARRWYERAATSGDAMFSHALRGLGSMLVTGEGGPADLTRGFAYLFIAKAAGDDQAPLLLEDYKELLTPEIEKQAHAIAEAWMKANLPA